MKLTSANKRAGILTACFILLGSACVQKTEQELLYGTWAYISVSRGDSAVMDVTQDDLLYLRSDSSFEYHIASENLQREGRWTYSGDSLHLKYAQPDTLRHFELDLVSEYSLKFHEGPLQFAFKKSSE